MCRRRFSLLTGASTGLHIQAADPDLPVPVAMIPEDCLSQVLTFLPCSDLASAAAVCRAWNACVYMPSVWHHLDLSRSFHMGAFEYPCGRHRFALRDL